MQNKLDVKIDTGALKDTVLNFIVPLVCFAISAVLVILVIYPSVQKVPQLKTDLQSRILLQSQLATKVSTLNKLTDYKSVLEEDLDLLDKVLVSDDNVPYLLNQIDQISRGVGLALSKLNYGVGGSGETADAGVTAEYVAVNLGVAGNYEQLVRFLQNTEKAARLINVSNFRYTISSSDTNDSNLSFSFLIYSPYLKVNSTATTDDPIVLDLSDSTFVKTINFLKTFTFYESKEPSAALLAEEKTISEVEAPVEEVPASPDVPQTTETPVI